MDSAHRTAISTHHPKPVTSVRAKRVQQIKRKILAGKYRIDNATIAKALFMAR